MYQPPASSSSSPQKPNTGLPALTRYGSAPGAFLTRAVESVINGGGERDYSPSAAIGSIGGTRGSRQYFSGDSSSSLSSESGKVNSSNDPKQPGGGGGLQRSYGLNEIARGAGSLVRQSSSPAGFFSHLATDNGFSITRAAGGYNSHNATNGGHAVSRLKSQLSFTTQDSRSQFSEANENGSDGISSDNDRQNSTHSYTTASFGMDSWENCSSIAFSGPPNKQARTSDGGMYTCLNNLDSQFSMPQTSLDEMATMDKMLHIPEDSVPCKIRAKRGFATHPRSIAERERRTRISGKLKKLQELVPNMDKQTSYADMLDLAVHHIKGLQNDVQKLHQEMENCTCGCKKS